jgi:V/A-type H+/Na+-transporting ATPase subunit C
MTRRGRADFDYGNTRLRARKSALLNDGDYERLLGEDLDGLLAALQDTHHAADAEVAPLADGLERLHALVRSQLARSLEQMRSFYAGEARVLVDALLSRFDVQNVVAVLRARAHPGTATDDALAGLWPMGWLVEPVAREILRAQEMAGVVDLLARKNPDREQAKVLRAAHHEYERTEDLAALERAVVGHHAAQVAVRLSSTGRGGAALLRFARREVDERNLLVTLRLRDAIESGADDTPPPPETLLAGGSIPPAALAEVLSAKARTAGMATLAELAGGRWQAPLERWSKTGDLNALQRELERRAIADSISLFTTGDPLAVDVPLAFTTAKQVEARNLRLLGEATVRGIAPEIVRSELIWPGRLP